jgi:hypothetical protein
MLLFGTRVTLNGHPEYAGVVLDIGASAAESYVVAWSHHKPDDLRSWYFRPELTVVESPAESALRQIGRMLRLPLDAEPAAIVGAVADLKARLFAEVSKPPVCVKIDPARLVPILRLVKRADARPDDWVWAAGFSGKDAFAVGPMQKRDFARENLRYVVIGPDPATLICEAPPAPAEETVWGEP